MILFRTFSRNEAATGRFRRRAASVFGVFERPHEGGHSFGEGRLGRFASFGELEVDDVVVLVFLHEAVRLASVLTPEDGRMRARFRFRETWRLAALDRGFYFFLYERRLFFESGFDVIRLQTVFLEVLRLGDLGEVRVEVDQFFDFSLRLQNEGGPEVEEGLLGSGEEYVCIVGLFICGEVAQDVEVVARVSERVSMPSVGAVAVEGRLESEGFLLFFYVGEDLSDSREAGKSVVFAEALDCSPVVFALLPRIEGRLGVGVRRRGFSLRGRFGFEVFFCEDFCLVYLLVYQLFGLTPFDDFV